MRLLDDQILIRRSPAELTSQGGVHLPDRDVARPLRGVVLAVGPGRRPKCACVERVPVQVVPGQEVLHARYAGTDVVVDGAECLVLRESDVLGVLEESGGG